MKRIFFMFLALALTAVTVFGCADPISGSYGDGSDLSTDSSAASSSDSSSDSEDQPDLPEMEIANEYTVLSSKTVSAFVTQDGAKAEQTARVAALKHENGDSALYFDVLSSDGVILDSIIWVGNCQLYMNGEGALILMRVAVQETMRGVALYTYYDISDKKSSGYDIIELDSPEINQVPQKGESLNFTVSTPPEIAHYSLMYDNLMTGFQITLQDEIDSGRGIVLIADSYLHPDSPMLYSNNSGTPIPDFEDSAVLNKYTLDYVIDINE